MSSSADERGPSAGPPQAGPHPLGGSPAVPGGQGADYSEGMSFLSTLPQRVVRVYIPLTLIVVVLLFPFYWMTMTAIKPKEHLLDLDAHNPFYTLSPTLDHIKDLLFRTDYPQWLWNTMFIAVSATILSLVASVFAAYAITRIRYSGFDAHGRVVEREAEGFHARVVQHECDHLIGRLYPTRMTDLTKLGFTSVLFPELDPASDD